MSKESSKVYREQRWMGPAGGINIKVKELVGRSDFSFQEESERRVRNKTEDKNYCIWGGGLRCPLEHETAIKGAVNRDCM